jgi:hypothetical protein
MRTKVCTKCRKEKLINKFYNSKGGMFGKNSVCKICQNAQNDLRKNNPNSSWMKYSKDYKLQERYNIILDEYQNLLKSQNGVCAICGKAESSTNCKGKIRHLSVDHNHKTGKIRGLLCGNCNLGFGSFKENISILKSAPKYARRT